MILKYSYSYINCKNCSSIKCICKDEIVGEVKKPVNMFDKKGNLMCQGWSRQPYNFQYNAPQSFFSSKKDNLYQFNEYYISTSQFSFNLVVNDFGKSNRFFIYFIKNSDKASPIYQQDEFCSKYLFKGIKFPSDINKPGTHARLNKKEFNIKFKVVKQGDQVLHLVRVKNEKLKLNADLTFDMSPKRESMVVVSPFRRGLYHFCYGNSNLVPVSGSLVVDGVDYLDPEECDQEDINAGLIWNRGYHSFSFIGVSAWGMYKNNKVALRIILGEQIPVAKSFINVNGVIHPLGNINICKEDLNESCFTFFSKNARFKSPVKFTPSKVQNVGFQNRAIHLLTGSIQGDIILSNGEVIKLDSFNASAMSNCLSINNSLTHLLDIK